MVRVCGPRAQRAGDDDEVLSFPSPSETAAIGASQRGRSASNPTGGDGSGGRLTSEEIQAGVLGALDPQFVADRPAAADEGGIAVHPVGSPVTSHASRGNPRYGIGRRHPSPASRQTLFSKRFKSLRPVGTHPALGSQSAQPALFWNPVCTAGRLLSRLTP